MSVMTTAQKTSYDNAVSGLANGAAAAAATTVTCSGGITGTGTLGANLTIACTYGTTSNTVCQGNDSRVVNAIQKDGSVAYTANQPFGSHKATGQAAGTATGDGAIWDQLAAHNMGYPAAVDGTGHSHVAGRPNFNLYRYWEFYAPSLLVSGGALYGDQWNTAVSGTGAIAGYNNANTATEIGLLSLSTGTTTTGAATASAWGTTTATGLAMILANADPFETEWRSSTFTASDGTNTWIMRCGVYSTANAAPADGFWFEWDANASTHIFFCTCSGGAGNVVRTDTGIVGGTAYHRMNVTKAAGTNNMVVTIDGTLIGSTFPCPIVNLIGPAATVIKSAGTTARIALFDWCFIDRTWAAGRVA